MPSVDAILQTIASQMKTSVLPAVDTADLTPVPDAVETPAKDVEISGIIVDTSAKTVTFDYLVYTTYKTAGSSVVYLTHANGTTAAISLPNLCDLLPAVNVEATATAAKNGNKVQFVITATIIYNSSEPRRYKVVVE